MPRSIEQRSHAYVTLFEEIWHEVEPLIGAHTLSGLFEAARRHAAVTHAFIQGLPIPTAGIDRIELGGFMAGAPPDQVSSGLAAFVGHLLILLESVGGPALVRQIMPMVTRAEKDD